MLRVIKKTYEGILANPNREQEALDYVNKSLDAFKETDESRGLTRYLSRCKTEIKNLQTLITIGETDDMHLATLDTLIEKQEERRNTATNMEAYVAGLEETITKLSADELKHQIHRLGVLYTTAPVLPIVTDPFEVSVLKAQKIKYENFANYIVLTEQKVLAFTRDNRGKAQKMLKHIKGVRQVTKRPYVNDGITWYWLSDNLDGLVLANETFDIQTWSPFLRSE